LCSKSAVKYMKPHSMWEATELIHPGDRCSEVCVRACRWSERRAVQIFAVVLITTVTLMTEHRHSGIDVFPLPRMYCNVFDPAFHWTTAATDLSM